MGTPCSHGTAALYGRCFHSPARMCSTDHGVVTTAGRRCPRHPRWPQRGAVRGCQGVPNTNLTCAARNTPAAAPGSAPRRGRKRPSQQQTLKTRDSAGRMRCGGGGHTGVCHQARGDSNKERFLPRNGDFTWELCPKALFRVILLCCGVWQAPAQREMPLPWRQVWRRYPTLWG